MHWKEARKRDTNWRRGFPSQAVCLIDLNLREAARSIRYRRTGSRFEQIFTYYRRARQHFPKRYQNMLRLRLPDHP
jgi:hypothetical protein